MGRRAQIVRLRWRDADLQVGAVEWGVEESARKSRAVRRVVPVVRPLIVLLKRAHLERGEPAGDQLVGRPLRESRRGILPTGGLADRATKTWGWRRDGRGGPWIRSRADALEPIGLHQYRHTAATWLDAAGGSPKGVLGRLGHATPEGPAGGVALKAPGHTRQ